jgi:hypothetical protein
MIAERLPDCRPPRRDENLISAAYHPELLSGYLAMRPRVPIALTTAERAMHRKWSRCTIAAAALVVAGVLALPMFKQPANGGLEARAHSPPHASTCAPWDAAASQAITRLAQSGVDADVRQVSDAVMRMRSARRSCELGWVIAACHDYQAIVRSAPPSETVLDESWSCEAPPA